MMPRNMQLKVLILLASATTAIMICQGLTDRFSYDNLAVSSCVDSSGRLEVYPFLEAANSVNQGGNLRSIRLLVVLEPVFLHLVAGLPLELLQFMGLTGTLLPLLGFILARRLLQSEIYGLAFGAFMALETDNLLLTYNLNIVGYGYLYYLLIIIIWTRFHGRRDWSLLAVFSVMTLLSYYVAEFYAFIFLFLVELASSISNNRQRKFRPLRAALLFFLVVILFFEPLVTDYFRVIVRGQFQNILTTTLRYVTDVSNLIGPEHAQTTYIKAPPYIFEVNVALYLLIFVPALLYFYRSLHTKGFLRKSRTTSVFWAIFITGLISAVLYIGWGGFIDNKYFLFLYPLLALIGIKSVFGDRRVNVRRPYVGILLAILLLRFGLFVSGPWADSSLSRTLTTQVDFKWISSNSGPIEQRPSPPLILLSDMEGAGRLLLAYAEARQYDNVVIFAYKMSNASDFIYTGTSDSKQAFLARYSAHGSRVTFIIVLTNNIHEPLIGNNWLYLPPLGDSGMFDSPTANIVFSGYRTILLEV